MKLKSYWYTIFQGKIWVRSKWTSLDDLQPILIILLVYYSIILISYKIRLITDQSKLEQVGAVWIARFVYVRQK